MSELKDCYRQLERIAKGMNIKKSMNDNKSLNLCGMPRSKIEKAMAMDAASKTPEGAILAKRIIALQNQKAMRMQYAPFLKNMPEVAGDLTDDSTFERCQEAARRRAQGEDDDDITLEEIRAMIRDAKKKYGLDDDEWSSLFSEA